ncbi:MAG: glycosyltransferase family 2 protein [Pseudomonadota bacterium]
MAPDLRFFLALTVKNEAPNLWEWVAYHRAIGFTDIAIYQNDSVDGTQKMLRTMEKLGFIQYFNNPSRNKGWQNKAYRRASRLPEFHAADWAMALDCDEFLVVKTGDGSVSALVETLPPGANSCTVHWKAFGSSFHAEMPDGLVTEEFTLAETPRRIVGRQMGFKSIFKPSAYKRIGIHKPKDAFPDVPSVMCNGSGILLDPDVDPGWRSKDPGARKLAQVNHYAIRDVERFLVKSGRGRTANHDRPVDTDYWRAFDINDAEDLAAARRGVETRAEMDRMNKRSRGRIELLHHEGRAANRSVFRDMLGDPFYRGIYDEIVAGFPAAGHEETRTGTQ